MNLSAVALITAVAIGLVRLHTLAVQFQMLTTANVPQGDRMLGMSNALLLLPLPVLLLLVWSTKVKLRVSEFDRGLAIVGALVLALFSTLPGMFQLLRLLPRMGATQGLWVVAGLLSQFMAMVFLLVFASQRDESMALGMQAPNETPYETTSVRTPAAIAMWAGAIAILVYVMMTALMFIDAFGSVGLRGGYLSARVFGFFPVVVSFVMALVIYRSDPASART
jgi:hypothetical protein